MKRKRGAIGGGIAAALFLSMSAAPSRARGLEDGLAKWRAFRFRDAADAFARVANEPGGSVVDRRMAAENAVVLYAALDEDASLGAMATAHAATRPAPAEKLRVEALVADRAFRGWRQNEGDAAARIRAEKAFERLYDDARTARRLRVVIEAAYRIGTMKRAAGDAASKVWFARVGDAWSSYRNGDRQDAEDARRWPVVDWAAEAALAPAMDALRTWERKARPSACTDVSQKEVDAHARALQDVSEQVFDRARSFSTSPAMAHALASVSSDHANLSSALASSSCGDRAREAKELAWAVSYAAAAVAVFPDAGAIAFLRRTADAVGEARMADLVAHTFDPRNPGHFLAYTPGMYARIRVEEGGAAVVVPVASFSPEPVLP